MKHSIRMVSLLLTVILIVSLCACGKPDPRAAMAGKYSFYAMKLGDSLVQIDEMKGYSVTLSADGTGSLDWGEDNNGPISEWTADGEKLVIKAGISVMNATMKDGVLTIDLSDSDYSMFSVFVSDSADTSSMPVITADEYAAQNGITQ